MTSIVSIVVNFNSEPGIEQCLDSLLQQHVDGEHHIVLWENGSARDVGGLSLPTYGQRVGGKLLSYLGAGINWGYAGGIQRAWTAYLSHNQAPDYVHLCNPDTYAASRSTLSRLVEAATVKAAITGPSMYDSSGRPRPSAYPILKPYNFWLHYYTRGWMTRLARYGPQQSSRDVGVLDGAYLVIPIAAWERLGGLDSGYFLYTDDHDLGMRAAAAGVRRWFESEVSVEHVGGSSRVHRPLLCELEEVRCSLRFINRFYGRAATSRARRLIALRFAVSVDTRAHGCLRWWARVAPLGLHSGSEGIEAAYLSWLEDTHEQRGRLLRRRIEHEISS